jgi:hypothetical protein
MTTICVVIPTTGRETLERAVRSAEAFADQVLVVAANAPHVDASLHVDLGCPGLVRNAAAKYVWTDLVAFCDDDDVLVPEVYRRGVEAHPAVDMLIHTMWDRSVGYVPRPGWPLEYGNVGISFVLQTALWREQLFIAGPPATFRGEDFELVRRFIDQDRTIAASGEVGYLVRPQEGQS